MAEVTWTTAVSWIEAEMVVEKRPAGVRVEGRYYLSAKHALAHRVQAAIDAQLALIALVMSRRARP
jgi:hypothetical protein